MPELDCIVRFVVEALLVNDLNPIPSNVVVAKAEVPVRFPEIVWVPDVAPKKIVPVTAPEFLKTSLLVKLPKTVKSVGA